MPVAPVGSSGPAWADAAKQAATDAASSLRLSAILLFPPCIMCAFYSCSPAYTGLFARHRFLKDIANAQMPTRVSLAARRSAIQHVCVIRAQKQRFPLTDAHAQTGA